MIMSRHASRGPQEPDASEAEDDQVFFVDGAPVAFYLYGTNEEDSSWALSAGRRQVLSHEIIQHGGRVCDSVGEANTVLVKEEGLSDLRHRYSLVRNRYAETPSFVGTCIRNGRYAHERIPQKAMSGRIPGSYRESFTPEDDKHLCQFIAHTIPYPEAGGRTGNRLYITLIEAAEHNPEFSWAKRHTAQSWRERYKKNKARLDPIIARMVAKSPPPPDGKGLFRYDRRLNKHHAFMNAQVEEEPYRLPSEEHDEFAKWVDVDLDAELLGERGRDASPEEEPRGRTRSATRHDFESRRSVSPLGEFEKYADANFEDGQGPEDAGPSGTQRTPSLSPSLPPTPPRQAASSKVVPRPRPRPPAHVVAEELSAASHASQFPASSQATLVDPIPSQRRRPEAPSTQRGLPAGWKAAKRRRMDFPEPPIVFIASQPKVHPKPRSVAQHHRGAEVQGGEQLSDDVRYPRLDELQQSLPLGQTNGEELDVEKLLGESAQDSGEFPADVSESLDSDDERARQKLLPARPRPSAASAGLSRSASSRKRSRGAVSDDDEAFANSLSDLTGLGPTPRLLSSASVRPQIPKTPFPIRRERTAGSTSSGNGSLDSVPLPGTKASEEKRKVIESVKREVYEPPSGTRAEDLKKTMRLRK